MACVFNNHCGCRNNNSNCPVFIPGPPGPQGLQGPQGPQGFPGAQGATGATGPSMTVSSAYMGDTLSVPVSVVVAGTLVPLATQLLSPDIVANSATTFTVMTAGRYLVTYHVNLSAAAPLGIHVLLNGAEVPILTYPIGNLKETYTGQGLVDIAAGSTVSLEFYGIDIVANPVMGNGISLTMVRVS